MRVVSGTARGLRLLSPQGVNTRPTADRMKEALFSMLADTVREAAFLDLYAGSGQIGIEALSRGAAQAVFVERDNHCARLIEDNLAHARLSEKGRVVRGDCMQAVAALGRQNARFHVVFMDPPYGAGLVEQTLRAVSEYGLLEPGGLAVAEQDASLPPPDVKGLAAVKIKTYKTTAFVFMERL